MEPSVAYEKAVEGWTARVAQVGPDQWREATPCADWDVRALVNHVVGEDLWTEPLMHGATIADVGDRFDGDLLGEDPVSAALDAARRATSAVAQLLPTQGSVHLSYGEERMEEYVAQLTADHLVHAWDLAVATGGDTDFDDDLVATVGSWFAEREGLYRSAGLVDERVTGVGDDPWSRLLAAFGRNAAWPG